MWSYDVTRLKEEPIYQVRFDLGDTDEEVPLLQDEEIKFSLDLKSGDITQAVISCAEALAARLSSQVDYKLGPFSINASERAKFYEKLASDLKKKLAGYGMPNFTPPAAGAIFDVDMMNNGADHHPSKHEIPGG